MDAYLKATFPEWNEDATMQLMFNDFGSLEEANPEAFQTRIKFWKGVIYGCAKQGFLGGGHFELRTEGLEALFKRKGLVPMGLKHVLLAIVKENEYGSSLSRKSVPQAALEMLLGAFRSFGLSNSELSIPTSILLTRSLDEAATYILSTNWEFPAVSINELMLTYPSYSRADLLLLLNRMLSKLSIVAFDAKGKLPLKTLTENVLPHAVIMKQSPSKNEIEQAFIRICIANLGQAIEKMHAMVDESAQKAVGLAKRGSRPAALMELKRKKQLEAFLDDKLSQKNTLDLLALRIDSIEIDRVVIEGYRTGSESLKSALADIDVRQLNDLFDEIADLTVCCNDVAAIVSGDFSPTITASAEDELEALVQEISAKRVLTAAPAVPTHVIRSKTAPEPVLTQRDRELEEEF